MIFCGSPCTFFFLRPAKAAGCVVWCVVFGRTRLWLGGLASADLSAGGRVDACVFDKTGTLTSETMEVEGVKHCGADTPPFPAQAVRFSG